MWTWLLELVKPPSFQRSCFFHGHFLTPWMLWEAGLVDKNTEGVPCSFNYPKRFACSRYCHPPLPLRPQPATTESSLLISKPSYCTVSASALLPNFLLLTSPLLYWWMPIDFVSFFWKWVRKLGDQDSFTVNRKRSLCFDYCHATNAKSSVFLVATVSYWYIAHK